MENYPCGQVACVLGFDSFGPKKKLMCWGASVAQIWKIRSSEQARQEKTVKDHSCDSEVLYGSDRRWNLGVPTPLTGNPSLQTGSLAGRNTML